MKESREYKIEGRPKWKRIGKLRNNVAIRVVLVINFKKYI